MKRVPRDPEMYRGVREPLKELLAAATLDSALPDYYVEDLVQQALRALEEAR